MTILLKTASGFLSASRSLIGHLSDRTTLCVLLSGLFGFILGVNFMYLTMVNSRCQSKVATSASNNRPHLREKRPPRIFCWILTSPANQIKARNVRDTWAKRCDKFVFVSSANDTTLPAVDLGAPEGYKFLWAKTKAAFRYAHRYHLNDYDFFLKADDDTYVIIENLKYMLRNSDPDVPFFTGRRFRPFTHSGYLSGGSGYVLSRGAVRRLVEHALTNETGLKHALTNETGRCDMGQTGSEDVNIAICLEAVGVKLADSLDELGRERFHPYQPERHLDPYGFDKGHWLREYNYYPLKVGPDCCSNTSISFHYVSPAQMLAIEFLIYNVRP